MDKQSMDELARSASEALDIPIVVHGRRAAYYAAETDTAYWLTREDLAYAQECVDAFAADAYSHWCTGTGLEMSARMAREIFGRADAGK